MAALVLAVPPVSAAAGQSTTSATATSAAAKQAAAAAARRKASRQRAAAAAARAQADAEQPRFKTDENGVQVPDIRAEAAIVYDPQTGRVVWESNSQNQRSIASITKLMTALVFLEGEPDLTRRVTVQPADVRSASTTYLRAGYTVTLNDLLHLTLVASDNAAARALARTSPPGSEGFIARMNERAAEMELTSTRYADPSGLLATNVSSAFDIARLIAYASNDERMAGVMREASYSFPVGRTTVEVRSTNQLLVKGDVDVQAGKTGFIRKAGYCLAALLRLPEGGPQVAVVVLGAESSLLRFWEARHLLNWVASQVPALAE
jgi:D-alanyl-D-alanine endopeptidase (penicillin-binding protein 7)